MKRYINKQIKLNKDSNLFYSNLENVIRIDNDFLDELLKLKKKRQFITFNAIEKTVKKVLEILYGINQYINIQNDDLEDLKIIYKETFDKINDHNIREIIIEHHRQLSKWLSKFYPDNFINHLKNKVKIGTILNEEYSAEFQIDILDLDPDNLPEPILDIGCGKNGYLVEKLNKMNKEAYGLDRLIKTKSASFIEQNWFNYQLKEKSWGTIIANMSFTNHLLYVYKNDVGNLSNYLSKFKEILDSLIPDGRMIYAPSVPWIENYLDRNFYQIKTDRIISGISRTLILKR